MMTACKYILRKYMSQCLHKTRSDLKLSQAKFSEMLMIDPRSYFDLERGTNLCGTMTFIIYLAFYCNDVQGLIDDLRTILSRELHKDSMLN